MMLARGLKLFAVGALAISTALTALQREGDAIEPSLELLEYLGMLLEDQDGYIGPEAFDDKETDDDRNPDKRDNQMTDADGTSTERGTLP
ncbi:MAG: hypothetical protein QGD92_01130 [Gammaproteobacteria bacterium]|nr:hypothetical protein [Gammaproteobacteria bacterium]